MRQLWKEFWISDRAGALQALGILLGGLFLYAIDAVFTK